MCNQLSCYGVEYNTRAKECQVCSQAIPCWEIWNMLSKKSVIKNGYGTSILNIISQRERVTVNEINKTLSVRFPGKELNIYYYLGILKKSGLINVEIEGRQRYYSII